MKRVSLPHPEDAETTLRRLFPRTKSMGNSKSEGDKRKSKYRKSALARQICNKKKPFTETLKDVFLIPDPSMTNVPRRGTRERLYKKGLVASAVKFNNRVGDIDIRVEIASRFEQFDLDIIFLKAVNDSLMEPAVIS